MADEKKYCVYVVRSDFLGLKPQLAVGAIVCVDCPEDGQCPNSTGEFTINLTDAEGNKASGRVSKLNYGTKCEPCPEKGPGGAVVQRGFKFTPTNCFIATVVYGAHSHQVIALQKLRDEYYSKHTFGQLLIKTYYWMSPPIASVLSKWPGARSVSRWILNIVIRVLTKGPEHTNG